MINTQLKFDGKILTVQVIEFARDHTKFLSLKAHFTLKVKVKVTSFQTSLRHFRCLINISSWNVKFETVQCLTVKIKNLEVWPI